MTTNLYITALAAMVAFGLACQRTPSTTTVHANPGSPAPQVSGAQPPAEAHADGTRVPTAEEIAFHEEVFGISATALAYRGIALGGAMPPVEMPGPPAPPMPPDPAPPAPPAPSPSPSLTCEFALAANALAFSTNQPGVIAVKVTSGGSVASNPVTIDWGNFSGTEAYAAGPSRLYNAALGIAYFSKMFPSYQPPMMAVTVNVAGTLCTPMAGTGSQYGHSYFVMEGVESFVQDSDPVVLPGAIASMSMTNLTGAIVQWTKVYGGWPNLNAAYRVKYTGFPASATAPVPGEADADTPYATTVLAFVWELNGKLRIVAPPGSAAMGEIKAVSRVAAPVVIAAELMAVTGGAITANSIELLAMPGGGGTTGIRVAFQPGFTAPANCNAVGTIGSFSHTLTGLAASTTYAFRVCAVEGASVSSGVTMTATTSAAGGACSLTINGPTNVFLPSMPVVLTANLYCGGSYVRTLTNGYDEVFWIYSGPSSLDIMTGSYTPVCAPMGTCTDTISVHYPDNDAWGTQVVTIISGPEETEEEEEDVGAL